MKRFSKLLQRFRQDAKGSISIEFGVLAAVLVGLLFSGVEYGRYILAGQKADRSTAAVGDMVSQSISLESAGMKDIFTAAGKILAHYQYKGRGVLIVSHVHATSAGKPNVVWQEFSSDTFRPASKIGSAGGPAKMPKTLTMRAGDTVIVVEAHVKFEPMLFDLAIGSRKIYRANFYRPRKSETIDYTKNGSTAIDVNACKPGQSGKGAEVCGAGS